MRYTPPKSSKTVGPKKEDDFAARCPPDRWQCLIRRPSGGNERKDDRVVITID